MLNAMFERVFGCSHRATTFPLTPLCSTGRRSATSSGNTHRTYIVCLDCGKEFGYDWNAMRIEEPAGLSPFGTELMGIFRRVRAGRPEFARPESPPAASRAS